MLSIVDYIREFGEYDFEAKPFNDVDGLILAQFCYLKFDKIVPGVGQVKQSVCLKDMRKHPDYESMFTDERYAKDNIELFEAMAESARFGDIMLNHYLNLVNKQWEMQFSAVCLYLPKDVAFVAFRGTDESIIGWKEDFNMAFMPTVPAQIKAADYLNYVAERINGDFMVGGHSKGGNLAVYATMKCHELTKNRIRAAYSYDGPGFRLEVLEGDEYKAISAKIRKLVPKSSIIGMLLQNQENYIVVESKSLGIMQHNPFNWIVVEDDFLHAEGLSGNAVIQDDSINEWRSSTDPEQMRIVVDKLFEVIDKTGITDLNDIKGNYAEILIKFTQAIDELEDDEKELMKSIFKSLYSTFIEKVKIRQNKLIADVQDKINRKSI